MTNRILRFPRAEQQDYIRERRQVVADVCRSGLLPEGVDFEIPHDPTEGVTMRVNAEITKIPVDGFVHHFAMELLSLAFRIEKAARAISAATEAAEEGGDA